MTKKYQSISEAADFLNLELKQKPNLNQFDVIEMAARGKINLCVPFDGIVAEFRYNYPEPVRANTWRFSLKNAYIKIPSEAIKLRGGIVQINSIVLAQVVKNTDYKAVIPFFGGGCENLSEAKRGCFWGMCTSDSKNSGKIKHTPVEANSDDAVIPKQDLLNFLENNKEPEQPEPQITQIKTDTAKTTDELSWQDQARLIADEFFNADTKNGCRDSLKGYSRRVMDEMQKREIHGARGRITEPSYIMREALQAKKWWANKQK